MNHEEQQEREEKEIFKKFAEICPLDICLDSIKTQKPPKPDIICQLADGNKLEFELGEAMDEQFYRRMALATKQTMIGMRDYYNKLKENQKLEFDRLYGNASIYFEFNQCATKIKRQNVHSEIFDFLLQLGSNFTGDIEPKTPKLRDICKKITVDRGNFRGPGFYEFSGGFVSEGVLEVISKKFNPTSPYELTYQSNLLVHIHHPSSKQVWIGNVQKFVEENITDSQFKHVWVFDYHTGKIEYVYPNSTVN